jgi:L-2,4-diaminobutyric acid acetyltransferase
VIIRKPFITDGSRVNALIASCKPLDTNSTYCNLLQCTHFAETCALAEDVNADGVIVGFVSAYLLPEKPNTLFIWQIAVSVHARGQGLGNRLLKEILSRPACYAVTFLETTITENNRASRALFSSLASEYGADLQQQVLFDKDQHFAGQHDSEILLRIGPIHHQKTQQDK